MFSLNALFLTTLSTHLNVYYDDGEMVMMMMERYITAKRFPPGNTVQLASLCKMEN